MNLELTKERILWIGKERYQPWPSFAPVGIDQKGGFFLARSLLTALTAEDLACWAWRKEIPPEIIAAVASYPFAHAELLQCAQVDPVAFLKVYRQCPALLPFMAAFWAFVVLEGRGIPEDEERIVHQQRMLRMPMQRVLPTIGLKPRRELIRILAKLKPSHCHEFFLSGLLNVLKNRASVRLLRHLPPINEDVLFLLEMTPPVHDYQILHLAATEPSFEGRRIRDVVWDIRDAREKRRVVPLWPYRGHVRSWQGLVKAWCRQVNGPRYWFPGPPVDAPEKGRYDLHLEPLRTEEAVREEAETMQNCAAQFAEEIAQRNAYLYRLLEPERATVLLRRARNGGWQIAEAQLEGNVAEVSADTMSQLFEWLFDTPAKAASNKKSL